MRRKKKKIEEQEQKYVVMNEVDEVYTGMLETQFQYSSRWDNYKPLTYSNTRFLRRSNPKVTLIELEKFIK
jgi:hypothetical protein